MLQFIMKRLLLMVPTLLIVSIISFIIIQLPPGDFLTTYAAFLRETGENIDSRALEEMRETYGLNQPVYVQYWKWISGIILRGDFGHSLEWKQKVSTLIADRMMLTMIVAMGSLIFTYLLAIPIGIYSATHQYSFADYAATSVGFLGLATPNFLLALVLMFIFYRFFDMSVSGLFSPEFIEAPWSMARVVDLINHLWIPIIVIGTAGTCKLIRVMRGALLDELRKQYVITARAKGVAEKTLLFKYPVRAALNPIVSTIGWTLPEIFSGSTITAIVLNLPTQGPLLYKALTSQDMYLAGSFLLILAALTIIGTLISDVALAWLDPRIHLGKEKA
jgi:peptide/nickel transport system permease protein